MSHPSSSGDQVSVIPKSHTIWIPPPPNLPCSDLLKGSREDYIKVGIPLFQAATKGDWEAAKALLGHRPKLVHYAITENKETLLHIAASAESTKAVENFVKNLVNLMDMKDLELQNRSYDIALSLAAQAGNIETAKIMMEKNRHLIDISNDNRIMPLYMAALFAKPDMVRYLYDKSNHMRGDCWVNENRGWVLQKCVEAEIFDVALKIVDDYPNLAFKKRLLSNVLLALAHNAGAFEKKETYVFKIIMSMFNVKVRLHEKDTEAMQFLRKIWEKIVIMPKREIDDILRGQPLKVETYPSSPTKNGYYKTYLSRILFVATKMGNTRFIVELVRLYPDLIWKVDDKEKTIFHLAVRCRQINIYKLLFEVGAMKDLITPMKDYKGNNMLHMVAKRIKQKRLQHVSGAAFQMQRELLWYKEVEKMVPPKLRQEKNNGGQTPQELFTETREKLLKEGGEWMKHTSSQCMVVATLIATIVFAAAFTLPGGYNQNTGIPFFSKEPSLIIFVISDAVSLICSSTSILMFLSILTSRYAEDDFVESLPRKLVNGIATLFLSIVTMMIAFSASFFLLYNKKLEWIPITITGLAGIPVTLYVFLHQGLFMDVFKAAYQSKRLFKHTNKHTLYS
ncbi:uncharacterized protein LOC143616442 [Bidens hawaiensis]|uniref:uncharacterized protein LOC143616442 n=1 Tax=Bidens hawaiensis TaxID=980011 RepID=UPI00404A8291